MLAKVWQSGKQSRHKALTMGNLINYKEITWRDSLLIKRWIGITWQAVKKVVHSIPWVFHCSSSPIRPTAGSCWFVSTYNLFNDSVFTQYPISLSILLYIILRNIVACCLMGDVRRSMSGHSTVLIRYIHFLCTVGTRSSNLFTQFRRLSAVRAAVNSSLEFSNSRFKLSALRRRQSCWESKH